MSKTLLGDYPISLQKFAGLNVKQFGSKEFSKLNEGQKYDAVNKALHQLVSKEKSPCFLMPAVLDFIEKINELNVLDNYAFYHFELWLNQFSGLSHEENYDVRAKIVGKSLPRDAYQALFPIGMGKVYPGSHYVTAHGSPDLDTTIASFWGWVDAFAARVSEGLHLWNVPGGPPVAIELGFLFETPFGKNVFQNLAKTRTTLALSGIDLMTQKGLVRKKTDESTLKVDHERVESAVVLVDNRGYYLGDWRSFDVEGVRQVILMLNNCLRWLENHFHSRLIGLFAKEKLSLKDLPKFVDGIAEIKIGESEPAKDLTEKQRKHLDDYLTKVLQVKKGLGSTLQEFAKAMKALSIFDFEEFIKLIEGMPKSSLFDKSGSLVEDRPRIFHYFEKIIKALDNAILSARAYVERLDVALKIKTDVFGRLPHHVNYRADVDEIKSKLGEYPYLTVTSSDKDGMTMPLGVVHAQDLHKPILGTVTLRDFCNREETKIPSYFEVISVIDHHKSSLQTTSPTMALISDAQSSNVLCAEMAFGINDAYSCGGLGKDQIKKQVAAAAADLKSAGKMRVMQRLLGRQMATEGDFFVDPMREFLEYLHFLYGVFDDTDLLTKVSQKDVLCVKDLVNRLKSISLQKEVEIIDFDDIPQDGNFAKKAAERILKNADVYSLYRKIYLAKEDAVDENIVFCSKGKPSSLFIDTKEQNGCARVGQTKIFAKNYPVYSKHVDAMRKQWFNDSRDFHKDHHETDLYLHMISTIAGAEDLYAGKEGGYKHKDELWIWIPFTEESIEHLKLFLNSFRSCPALQKDGLAVELYGEKAKEYEQIFKESFYPLPMQKMADKGALPVAILKYKAGLINSRKAMISPYLPKR